MTTDWDEVYRLVRDAFDTGYSMNSVTAEAHSLQRQLTVFNKTNAIFEMIERTTGSRLYLGNLDASPE